jgi:hypothetical protein
MAAREEQYQQVKSALLSANHIYLSLPTSPAPLHIAQKASVGSGPTISSLSLHPALESTLHILNMDLPSAHFLLRHAQSEPAWEMMYLHGILHRIEGDIDNAQCWYGDVKDSEVLKHVWAASDTSWEQFLDRVEYQKDVMAGAKEQKKAGSANSDIERADLQKISLWELKQVLAFCEDRFGIGEVTDASNTWVQPEGQIADKSNAMIVGGEGWREF